MSSESKDVFSTSRKYLFILLACLSWNTGEQTLPAKHDSGLIINDSIVIVLLATLLFLLSSSLSRDEQSVYPANDGNLNAMTSTWASIFMHWITSAVLMLKDCRNFVIG